MIKNEFRVDKKPYTDIIEKLADSLSIEFYNLAEKELSIFKELLSNIKPLLANNQLDSSEALQIFNLFNSQLGEFLNSSFPSADELEIKEIFKEYTKELEGMIAGMPKKVDYVQRETCFTPIEGDSFRIILLKQCKAIIRKGQSFFRNLANVFRKEKKGQPVWEHTVAIRQIFRYSMRNVFLSELLPSFRETLSKNNEVHFSLLEIGDQLSHWFFIGRANGDSELNAEEMLLGFNSMHNKAIADVKEARKCLKVEIKDSGMRALEKYEQLERISGTIEYPDRKSSARTINRSYTELNKQLTEVVHAYGNTSFYLFDDKRFDVSIDRLSTTLLAEQSKVNILLEKKYLTDLTSFTTAYAKLLAEMESFVAAKGTTLAVLRGIHKEFKSGFASLLIKSLSALKSAAIPVRIRSISRVLLNEVSTFPETKPFIKKFNPSTWTADKELNSIRPADILRFEILPEIEEALTDLASEAQLKLDLLFNHMTEIGTIADFSIESTIKQIREKHEGEHNPIDTLMNGLARSGEKISVILKVFDELKEQVEEELATITKEQVLEIQDLRAN
ncbi:MAG: hypothetical protein PF450_07200, partial [Bacteroidales bacterium]|nr:hypothetical protein [Bacteroidales bacterium]